MSRSNIDPRMLDTDAELYRSRDRDREYADYAYNRDLNYLRKTSDINNDAQNRSLERDVVYAQQKQAADNVRYQLDNLQASRQNATNSMANILNASQGMYTQRR